MKERHFMKWTFPEEDSSSPTPERIRDLIVECFTHSHLHSFQRAMQYNGNPMTQEEVQKKIELVVKHTFSEVGVSFQQPSPDGFPSVIKALAKKAELMGTPREIIDHNYAEIDKVLKAMGIR